MIFKVISTFEACVLAYVMSPFFFFCPEVGILEQVQFSLEVHRRIDLFIENCFRKWLSQEDFEDNNPVFI